jgi:hypothetical protein
MDRLSTYHRHQDDKYTMVETTTGFERTIEQHQPSDVNRNVHSTNTEAKSKHLQNGDYPFSKPSNIKKALYIAINARKHHNYERPSTSTAP